MSGTSSANASSLLALKLRPQRLHQLASQLTPDHFPRITVFGSCSELFLVLRKVLLGCFLTFAIEPRPLLWQFQEVQLSSFLRLLELLPQTAQLAPDKGLNCLAKSLSVIWSLDVHLAATRQEICWAEPCSWWHCLRRQS